MPNVFVVGEDVDELADRAALVTDARFDASVILLKVVEHIADRCALGADFFFAVCVLAKGSGNSNCDHRGNLST